MTVDCWLCAQPLDRGSVTFQKLRVRTCSGCAGFVREAATPYGGLAGRAVVLQRIKAAFEARASTPVPPAKE